MQSVYFPSDDEPIEHKILHVEDETNGPRKAREALRMARNYLDGPLGVTRSPNPQIEADPDKVCIIGSNEYAVYKLPLTPMDYEQLIDDVETRVSNGAHPEDATWNAVMEATPDTEEGNLRLNALYAKASEEAEENPAYLDPNASDAARMQSVVLAELRLRYQSQSKSVS